MTEFFIKRILAEEIFENRLCESLEDKQIVDFLYEELLLEKFLYGEPITVPELRKLLRTKILNFEFIKLDGEVRPAEGTTMMKYIPKVDHPKGIRPSSPKVATFFDLDKMAWRSVSQRSKEIVLKKDEEKGRPVIVVQDKGKEVKKVRGTEKPEKPVDVTGVRPEFEEPVDELKAGDIRNYLNRYDKNIQIEIVRVSDDGSVFAKTMADNAIFKVPEARLKNIGELVPGEEVQKGRNKIFTREPVQASPTPVEPQPKKPVEPPEVILLPKEQVQAKEPPEQMQTEEPGAEEL
jgi:hypothetical protein